MEEPNESSSLNEPLPNESEFKQAPDEFDDDFISGMVTTIELRRSQLPITADIVDPDVDPSSRQETQDFIDPDETDSEPQSIVANGAVRTRRTETRQRLSNRVRPPSSAVQAAKAAEDASQAEPTDDAPYPGSAADIAAGSAAAPPSAPSNAEVQRLEPGSISVKSKRRSQVATFVQAAGYAIVTFLALVGMAVLGYALAASDVLR